jgi:hypothetical protein
MMEMPSKYVSLDTSIIVKGLSGSIHVGLVMLLVAENFKFLCKFRSVIKQSTVQNPTTLQIPNSDICRNNFFSTD